MKSVLTLISHRWTQRLGLVAQQACISQAASKSDQSEVTTESDSPVARSESIDEETVARLPSVDSAAATKAAAPSAGSATATKAAAPQFSGFSSSSGGSSSSSGSISINQRGLVSGEHTVPVSPCNTGAVMVQPLGSNEKV